MSNNSSPIEFYFLTLFPEVYPSFLGSSLLGKAAHQNLVQFHVINIRDFSKDKHARVDDSPYGGGAGMLLKVDVLYEAWKSVVPEKNDSTRTILLSPQGKLFSQPVAKHMISNYKKIVLVSGHYEGVDERFIELCVDEEISIGDYVLTGGEIASLVLADTLTRLIPGVVGNQESISTESLEGGLLKYPQYTRPESFMGHQVPEVLLSGNHTQIKAWREAQSLERTSKKRPDLKKL